MHMVFVEKYLIDSPITIFAVMVCVYCSDRKIKVQSGNYILWLKGLCRIELCNSVRGAQFNVLVYAQHLYILKHLILKMFHKMIEVKLINGKANFRVLQYKKSSSIVPSM